MCVCVCVRVPYTKHSYDVTQTPRSILSMDTILHLSRVFYKVGIYPPPTWMCATYCYDQCFCRVSYRQTVAFCLICGQSLIRGFLLTI
jgi:hypothetical protein